jgi:hypothetical protein
VEEASSDALSVDDAAASLAPSEAVEVSAAADEVPEAESDEVDPHPMTTEPAITTARDVANNFFLIIFYSSPFLFLRKIAREMFFLLLHSALFPGSAASFYPDVSFLCNLSNPASVIPDISTLYGRDFLTGKSNSR